LQRWMTFENSVLMRISGPKRKKLTGGSRKLHNEELHNLYSSSNIIRVIKSRRMIWGTCSTYVEMRNSQNNLVEKFEEKRPLDRNKRIWEDNIKMDLRKTGCDDVDCIKLTQDRAQLCVPVDKVMILRVPQQTKKTQKFSPVAMKMLKNETGIGKIEKGNARTQTSQEACLTNCTFRVILKSRTKH